MNNSKQLTYLLGNTFGMVRYQLTARFKENNISLSMDHYIILTLIERDENITQQIIADHFNRDKSSILRQMNCLLDRRYVARIQDADDKRKKILMLTKVGYDALENARKVARKLSDELLDGVSEEEFETFIKVIMNIREKTGQTEFMA